MVCAVGKEDGTILEQVSIPTTTPEETIPKMISYFEDKGIAALGVATFGPADVNPKSDTYGYIPVSYTHLAAFPSFCASALPRKRKMAGQSLLRSPGILVPPRIVL